MRGRMDYVFNINLLLLCPALLLGSNQPETLRQELFSTLPGSEKTGDRGARCCSPSSVAHGRFSSYGKWICWYFAYWRKQFCFSARQPRFLFFGVTTTTTTLSTTTMCWYPNTAITTTCSKRKRSIDEDEEEEEEERKVSEEEVEVLMSGQREEDPVRRQPR